MSLIGFQVNRGVLHLSFIFPPRKSLPIVQSTSIPPSPFPVSAFFSFAAFSPSRSLISTSASKYFSSSFLFLVYPSFFSNFRAFFLDNGALCRRAWLVRGMVRLSTLPLLPMEDKCRRCLRLLLRTLAALGLDLDGVLGLARDGMLTVGVQFWRSGSSQDTIVSQILVCSLSVPKYMLLDKRNMASKARIAASTQSFEYVSNGRFPVPQADAQWLYTKS